MNEDKVEKLKSKYDSIASFDKKMDAFTSQAEKELKDVNIPLDLRMEVGSFLSSGVDSSYVSTYFADQKTFTVGFDFAAFSALFISSTLAIESITQIHIIANALPTALVSAFSNALVLLINQSHHLIHLLHDVLGYFQKVL